MPRWAHRGVRRPPMCDLLSFFCVTYNQKLRVQVELVIDKICLCYAYSSLKLRHVDGVLSVDFYGISTINSRSLVSWSSKKQNSIALSTT